MGDTSCAINSSYLKEDAFPCIHRVSYGTSLTLLPLVEAACTCCLEFARAARFFLKCRGASGSRVVCLLIWYGPYSFRFPQSGPNLWHVRLKLDASIQELQNTKEPQLRNSQTTQLSCLETLELSSSIVHSRNGPYSPNYARSGLVQPICFTHYFN